MKVIVDEEPSKAHQCVFSKYGRDFHYCLLTGNICYLEYENMKCKMLKKDGGINDSVHGSN